MKMIVDDPIMKYLDESTGTRANRIFKSWRNIVEEFGVSQKYDMELLHLTEVLAKRWEGRQAGGPFLIFPFAPFAPFVLFAHFNIFKILGNSWVSRIS